MCDCTRVDRPIQGSRDAQAVNHGQSTTVYTKPAQASERYRTQTKNPEPLECPIIAGFPVNSVNERGFGTIPTRVMDDARLSMGARCLYALLAAHAGSQHEAWPNVKRIIATLGCTEKTFYKYRSELSSAGYISIETRQTRYGRSTVYVIEQVVEYPSRTEPESEKEFSTNPSSEPYSKNYGMACDMSPSEAKMWKTNGGKQSHTVKNTVAHTVKNTDQNINKGIETKNSTTSQPVDNPRLGHDGTAIAEPVVADAHASGSKGKIEIEGKNEEAPLKCDAVDAAFTALEARSLRRTKSASSLDAAKASYRRLVREGHSPEEISDVYDHYVQWVKANAVQHPTGLAAWFARDDGWKLNYTALMSKRAAAKKATHEHPQGVAPDLEAGRQADLEYRKRSAAVKRTLTDSDAECAYMMAYAESSDDQRLRDIAAIIRREKPVQYSNGYVDDRISKRPSYDVLVRLAHSKKHIREYTSATYAALAAEGKVRG